MQNDIGATINDSTLAQKIGASFFEEDQKTRLIELLPQMTEDEKAQLLAIIEKTEKKIAGDETYQKDLSALNKETKKTMRKAVIEETSNACKAFEAYDHKVTETQLKAVEKEFEALPDPIRNKQKK